VPHAPFFVLLCSDPKVYSQECLDGDGAVWERGVRRAYVLGFLAALLLTAGAGVEAWVQSRAARDATLWVRHTYEVLDTAKDLGIALDDAGGEERGYLLTGDERHLEAYQSAVERVAPLKARLQRLTADNASQQDRLLALSPLVRRRLAELSRTLDARRDRGLDAALSAVVARVSVPVDLTVDIADRPPAAVESAESSEPVR